MEYISQYITQIFFSIPEIGRYILIFGASFIEGIPLVGAIFPGGTVALLVGSLSYEHFINSPIAIFFIASGCFLGDMIGFLIIRKYRNKLWIKRTISHEKHQKSWVLFDKRIALIVIFGKIVPFMRSVPLFFAAARGIEIYRYLFYSAIGSLLWASLGVYGGNILNKIFGKNAIIIILGMLIVSVIIILIKPKKSAS